MSKYFAIYKPYGMLSQFTREQENHVTLADLKHEFAKDVYPVGRLDKDSEGLLILSNDKSLTATLLEPSKRTPKTYYAQLDGQITEDAAWELKRGVTIKIKKNTHECLPAAVEILDAAPDLPDRDPPVRFRANIPTSWIEITIIEGKNRQVRKMCATVGYPVLRLVRVGVAKYKLPVDIKSGDVNEIEKSELLG